MDTKRQSVRVVVRCRPMNAAEKTRGDPHLFRFPSKERREMQVISSAGGGGARELVRSFQFDLCASEELSQAQFFRASGVVPLLDSVAEGYLATVFAYGQTGSGKTYSMSGVDELLAVVKKKPLDGSPSRVMDTTGELSDGITPRALKYLFGLFDEAPKEVKFVVRASYCEIYNEQVFDLLNPSSGSLSVRWNDRTGFYVQNLLVVQCDSLDDMLAVLHEGHRNRRVGSHDMNKDSSRSHSLLTVHVDRQTTDENDGHVVTKFGKVSFVDLAGSERLKETKSANAEETSNINRSLLTLGKVISALAAAANGGGNTNGANAPAAFVPYRDSKLTKLLMDSLGGNSLTLMIACVSPSAQALEDTLSTLNYATRAKNIQNRPAIQVDPVEFALSNLRKENHALRAENEVLRHRLRAQGGGVQASSLSSSTSRAQLPPLDRSPNGKYYKQTSQSPSGSPTRGADAYRNQLSSLRDENEMLVKQSAAADQQIQRLRGENETLRRQQQQQQHASMSPQRGGKSSPNKAQNNDTERLRQQVQQLQQREQELMQALVRGGFSNLSWIPAL